MDQARDNERRRRADQRRRFDCRRRLEPMGRTDYERSDRQAERHRAERADQSPADEDAWGRRRWGGVAMIGKLRGHAGVGDLDWSRPAGQLGRSRGSAAAAARPMGGDG